MLRAMWSMSMLLVAACVVREPPPPSGPPPAAVEPAEPPPAQPVDPAPAPVEPAPVPAAPGSVADGAACNVAADCASGICEGEGCGPNGGVCAPRNRACTRDLRTYCGCDGVTFRNSGSCPGARFSARSECPAAGGPPPVGTPDGSGATGSAPDGAACKAGPDCASGICEGMGCGAGDSGVCMAKKRPCTADLRPYCGCDGATFRSSGSCPGRRYSKKGGC